MGRLLYSLNSLNSTTLLLLMLLLSMYGCKVGTKLRCQHSRWAGGWNLGE